MKNVNWISTLSTLKTLAMLVWAMAFLALRLNWFQNEETVTSDILNTLKYFGIIIYCVLYFFELKLTVRQKNVEIAKLKTKLLEYEKQQA